MYNNLWLINPPVVAIFRWSPCGREHKHYVSPLNGEEICESQNVKVSPMRPVTLRVHVTCVPSLYFSRICAPPTVEVTFYYPDL